MMPAVVYLLCALTSVCCAVMLTRGFRRSRSRLLLWSALCFIGLAAENILLVADLVIFPAAVDLRLWRLSVGFGAILLLLTGLIWESS